MKNNKIGTLEWEIEDFTNRIQTHIDSKEKGYGFNWGHVSFFFHQDGQIEVNTDDVGVFYFTSARAVAEFVIFNIVPRIAKIDE